MENQEKTNVENPQRGTQSIGEITIGSLAEDLPQTPVYYTRQWYKESLTSAIDCMFLAIDSGDCSPARATALLSAISKIAEAEKLAENAMLHM